MGLKRDWLPSDRGRDCGLGARARCRSRSRGGARGGADPADRRQRVAGGGQVGDGGNSRGGNRQERGGRWTPANRWISEVIQAAGQECCSESPALRHDTHVREAQMRASRNHRILDSGISPQYTRPKYTSPPCKCPDRMQGHRHASPPS